jgi:hypothetical protein
MQRPMPTPLGPRHEDAITLWQAYGLWVASLLVAIAIYYWGYRSR